MEGSGSHEMDRFSLAWAVDLTPNHPAVSPNLFVVNVCVQCDFSQTFPMIAFARKTLKIACANLQEAIDVGEHAYFKNLDTSPKPRYLYDTHTRQRKARL